MEEQADYRAVTDRKVCPLMSKADPDVAGEVQPVFCLGGCCGMYALCQARIDLSGKDIKLTPPAVPGL